MRPHMSLNLEALETPLQAFEQLRGNQYQEKAVLSLMAVWPVAG